MATAERKMVGIEVDWHDKKHNLQRRQYNRRNALFHQQFKKQCKRAWKVHTRALGSGKFSLALRCNISGGC